MPIVSNRSYNDPALGAAFSNLAAAFGPPSGSDLAGYATANAKKAEAARAAEAWARMTDPNVSHSVADLYNYALNGNANNTYYSVDQSNATTRRGQDVTARASITNNQADNSRAIQTNAADNARAFAQTRYGAIGQNQMLPELPGSVASLYGVPASGPVQGNTVLNPGETLTTPDGRTIAGAPKPLSKDEVEAQVLGAILQKSNDPTATPDQRRSAQVLTDRIITNNSGVEKVIVDGKTVLAPGGSAALSGAQAAPTSQGAPDTKNYKTPNGEVGSAIFDPAKNRYVDMQTGRDIPAGSITFSGQLTGNSGDLGIGKRTDRDNQLDLISAGMMPGVAKLNEIYRTGKTASTSGLMANSWTANNPGWKDIAQAAGIISPQDQSIFAAMNSFMDNMYLVTGAARPESENVAALAQLTPLASDTPETKQLKWDTFNQKALALAHQSKDPIVRDQLLKAIHGIFASPATEAGVNESAISRAATSPGAPQATPDPLAAARDAIARGADKAAVVQRLRDHGIDPAGL